LIAPGLCAKVLLGLPWLSHNKIFVDHAARTAINKSCNFDLLNKCDTFPIHKHLPVFPKKKRDQILKFRKLLVGELKLKCAECLMFLTNKNQFETIKGMNFIAAIKDSIEPLASQDYLLNLETKLKSEYKEPIPHADLLPSILSALHLPYPETIGF
jgi:hypothetical protein